jgi:hypothetical protein
MWQERNKLEKLVQGCAGQGLGFNGTGNSLSSLQYFVWSSFHLTFQDGNQIRCSLLNLIFQFGFCKIQLEDVDKLRLLTQTMLEHGN